LDLAGDVVRDGAGGEVRVGVGVHQGHFRAGVQFAGAQRGGDAGVAAADGNQMCEKAFQELMILG
jgi:hypothetical protein